MTTETTKTAVVYARVSSTKQTSEGDGLASQETRCREYARYKGLGVSEVFTDEGVSGGLIDRPGMKAMLGWLRKHRAEECVVIIDDISRLARGLEAHMKLRAAIGSVGARLESPSIEFGEDSDSLLVENLLASVAQHQREKNGEQTINRMRARMMNGYWVFHAPVGYRFERVAGHGKLLVRNEPHASLIVEAMEGYATGRFASLVEVQRFFEGTNVFPKNRNGEVHPSRITELLERPIYAGHISYERWNLNFIPAKHEPLISLETWQAIQDRRRCVAKVTARKDINVDFPLRGFVTCGCCDEPLTACWSKGRSAKYPYYLCDTKGCELYRKSIRKEKIEGDFEALLTTLQPSRNLFEMSFDMFRDIWELKVTRSRETTLELRKNLTTIERKVSQLLDRIVDAESASVISAYETRVRDLEAEKAIISEKIGKSEQPPADFNEIYRTAFAFLSNPSILWASERLEDKRAVLKLTFADRLAYDRNQGYRTAETSLPFKALETLRLGKCDMVPLDGVEPPTFGLQNRR